jgi:hypothetical protein
MVESSTVYVATALIFGKVLTLRNVLILNIAYRILLVTKRAFRLLHNKEGNLNSEIF